MNAGPTIDYPRVLFTETQRFNRPAYRIAVGAVAVGSVAGWALLMYLFSRARGTVWMWSFVALLPGVAMAMSLMVGMGTTLRTDELTVRFFPLRRRIPLAQIESFEAIKYHWMELGGWGARWNGHYWSFTVQGDRAIRLRMRDGKRLVIGTQRIDELTADLESLGMTRSDKPVTPPA